MSAIERFSKYVKVTDKCWFWCGYKNKFGYGKFYFNHRSYFAYRWLYEYLHGPIPKRLEIDHLCRVRACVRPNHLEMVSKQENIKRSLPFFANRLKKICKRNHPFTVKNTGRRRNGKRYCKVCKRFYENIRYAQSLVTTKSRTIAKE